MEPRAMRVFTNRYKVDGRKEDQTNIVSKFKFIFRTKFCNERIRITDGGV